MKINNIFKSSEIQKGTLQPTTSYELQLYYTFLENITSLSDSQFIRKNLDKDAF